VHNRVTVANVLRLQVVVDGAPDVLAGRDHLNSTVAWVHVADSTSVATGLDGGELLLSTGTAWPSRDADLERYLGLLLEAKISGMIVELSDEFPHIPALAIRLFDQAHTPLIVLRHPIQFVRVTSVVHRQIIAGQEAALDARATVHALFTEMSLRGSPLDFIVGELARELSSTVVLEDEDRRVIAFAGDDGSALIGWEKLSARISSEAAWGSSRTGRTADCDESAFLISPIAARGRRFGNLIVFPSRPHLAGRATVLEQGAIALALNRLTSDDPVEWTRQSERLLVEALISGRYRSQQSLLGQLDGMGFPTTGREFAALALAVRGAEPLKKWADFLNLRLKEAGVASIVAITDSMSGRRVITAIVSHDPQLVLSELWVRHLASTLNRGAGADDFSALLSVGQSVDSVDDLLRSLINVRDSHDFSPTMQVGRIDVWRATDRPIDYLLAALAQDGRARWFIDQTLGPLLRHDGAHGSDLISVLEACVRAPGNRSAAAKASLLSRSVFYQRIAVIENLLGVSLRDGSTLSALHTALTLYRTRGTVNPGQWDRLVTG